VKSEPISAANEYDNDGNQREEDLRRARIAIADVTDVDRACTEHECELDKQKAAVYNVPYRKYEKPTTFRMLDHVVSCIQADSAADEDRKKQHCRLLREALIPFAEGMKNRKTNTANKNKQQ
jgi:hypothetical protein